uniref:GRIP1 associated protein 1 n=1 Tax=Stegastes partitus TaxID=144197 RepID=A0A3B5B9L2_9TELE
MSQALSEEEFHRMQAQLLELRTQNYQLSDDLRKNSAELNSVRQKNLVLERDFVKAQKEVEALLSENEMLQGKLHSQEEDFRLQNSTLMTELSKLCTQIEQLEQENQGLKEGGGASKSSPPPNPASSPVDGELLRLQAENSTLQKQMKGKLRPALNGDGNQGATMETDGSAGANGVSDVTGRGEEPAAGANERLEQVSEQVSELQTKIDEINQRKEEEVKAMNIRIQKLQTDLMAANQTTAELREQLQSKEKEHEVALHTLKDQVANQSAVSQEQVDNILQENDALRTNLAALEQIQTVKTQEMNLLREQQEALTAELQQRRSEQESLLAQRDDLDSQLQESSFANRKLLEQLTEEGQEKEKLLRELDEAKKTAEKRKSMLDDMAMQLNQEKSDHKEALSDLKLQHEKEVSVSQDGWICPSATVIWRTFSRSLVVCLQEKQEEMEGLKQQLVEVEKQKDEHVDAIGKLKQEIKDTVDGQRILEKKGSAALKDLKRQLQLERKRADKLQERLQEILTNSKTRTGLEELVLSEINSPSRTQQTGDSSSVSSFSYRDMMKEAQPTNQNKSGGGSPQSQRPAELSDDEVGELFQRLAEVQQEKWMLEEKVKHLEVSCSSMAEDICRKSAIIETYVMDSRIDVSGSAVGGHGGSQGDRGGLGSVLRDLVKPGDENLREMNKKLQNMLEEQLTKNMHLQKDLEVLSQELVRLSKENNPGGGAAGSG